jgi:potassium channel subfamily K, other eukaryote
MSNSGKPFFVFWSLLAIPTLTILISNMGDTVVKGVKDATIWLGEVTVLPSNEASVIDRLRYGVERMTLGFIDPERAPNFPNWTKKQKPEDDDSSDIQEMPPGLTKILPLRRRKRMSRNERNVGERLAEDFAQEEKLEENDAKDRGDQIAEDEHHYRRQLLEQIRRVYADSAASTPKKYTYEEWAFFLKLLGEDESDSRYHIRAGKKRPKAKRHGVSDASWVRDGLDGQMQILPPHQNQAHEADEDEIVQWSWIGPRSPLMGDKEEPEWLLAKLFQRLEDSMREAQEARDCAKQSSTTDKLQREETSDQETVRDETGSPGGQDSPPGSSGKT